MKIFDYKSALLKWFTVPDRDPDLLKAQYTANTKQIPLMYFLVVVSTWGLASSFWKSAPIVMSIILPMLLTFVAGMRFKTWLRIRTQVVNGRQALKALRTTNRVSGIISLIFVSWAIALSPYADEHTRGHISFYIGITVVGCLFCLMHIRSAALMVSLVINGGFIVFALIHQDSVFIAEAINVVLASGAMLALLSVNFSHFRSLIESRRRLMSQQKELIRREAVTRQLSAETRRLAYVDPLTDLPNRRQFFETLETKMKLDDGEGPDGTLIVGILDLDGFKRINDVYGHSGGDQLLKRVAQGLSSIENKDLFVARLGGDEFGLILDGSYDDEDLIEVGGLLRNCIVSSAGHGKGGPNVSASLGFKRWVDAASKAEDLYERADYALYQVKRAGAGYIEIFNAEHELDIQRVRFLERCLRSDSIEREISVAFQPIVDTGSGKVLAFEALARWQSDVFGPIPPMTFIPIAERIGLIDELTNKLFRMALKELQTWPEDIRLSFNLSPQSMASRDLIDGLVALLHETGVDPRRVDFEITETAMMGNFAEVQCAIEGLKREGIGIALDDFGTGYSSLVHLHKLPLDKIKIDKSFVANITSDSASYTIVKSLLALGQQLEVGCIVEGVETEQVLNVVRGLGGSVVQGYHFARPMPAEEVLPFLSEPSLARAAG